MEMYRTKNGCYLTYIILISICLTSGEEFPLLKFLLKAAPDGISNITNYDEGFVKFLYLCGGSSCCSCLDDCMETKSCCIDKLWNSSHPLPLETYLNNFKKASDVYKTRSCLAAIPFASSFGYESDAFLMVDNCLSGAPSDLVNKCLNDENLPLVQRLPVYGDDKYVYKNAFCARCNFIHTYYLANHTVHCKSRVNTTIVSKSKQNVLKEFVDCYVSIGHASENIPDLYYDICTLEYARKTSCQNKKHESLCHSYNGAVGQYKNIYCYACNNGKFPNIPFPTDLCLENSQHKPYTWSLTINFAGETRIAAVEKNYVELEELESYCKDGQIYSIFDGECKEFTCGNGFIRKGTACIKTPTPERKIMVGNPQFSRCLLVRHPYMYIAVKTNLFNITNFKDYFEKDFNTTEEHFEVLNTNVDFTVVKRHNPITQQSFPHFKNMLQNTSLFIWDFVSKFTITSSPHQLITERYGFDVSRTFANHRLCASKIEYSPSQGNFTNTCGFNTLIKYLDYSNINLWLTFTKDSVNENISHCNNYHLHSNCKRENITKDYAITENNTLTVQTFDRKTLIISPSDYVPTISGYSICKQDRLFAQTNKDYIQQYNWLTTVRKIEHYISIVGTSFSILCHLFFIVTFALFKKLRNKGNFNVLNMTCILLLADTLFLIATASHNSYSLCKMIGIVLHWSLLLVTMWSIVIATDLARHFLSSITATRKHYRDRHIWYVFVSIISSTLIVATTVTLNETSTIYIGYGAHGICWIGSFYPLMFSYMIPVASGYTISFISLCCVLRYLYITTKDTKKALKDSNIRDIRLLQIALKLVTVLGLTEVIGFVQIYGLQLSENELAFNSGFSLAYTLTRSLRGVAICFIYLINRKTLNLYKERFRTKDKNVEINVCHEKTQNKRFTQSADSIPDVQNKK